MSPEIALPGAGYLHRLLGYPGYLMIMQLEKVSRLVQNNVEERTR